MTARHRQRGSVSVELAILTPLFALLIVVAIVFGRTAIAAHAIDVAAHDAARAASISRSQSQAEANAVAAAMAALDHQGLDCLPEPLITPDASGFGQGDGELAFVSVEIVCEVSFVDIAIFNMATTRTLTTVFVSPIDIFREQ